MSTSVVKRDPLPEIPPGWDSTSQKGYPVKTYSGFQSDEVSSAFQKAVRRGNEVEAIQWALELFWTNLSQRTHIWNRSLTVAVEDIGVSDPYLILKVWSLRQNYEDDPVAIATVASLLATTKKSRVNDWACLLYPEVTQPEVALSLGTPLELKTKLKFALDQRDLDKALLYSKALFYTPTPIAGAYSKAQWYVWEALLEMTHDHPYVTILKEIGSSPNWRWTDKNRLLHTHIIHLWLTRRLGDASLPESKEASVSNTAGEVKVYPIVTLTSVVEKFRLRQGLVGIPDYAVDKHTQRGRNMHRGLDHFISEGALLSNEDSEWKGLSEAYLKLIDSSS